jgi:hypothetical protein
MLRLIVINILLFIGFMILFVVLAGAIGYAAGPNDHTKEVAYVGLWTLHLYINIKLLKKRDMIALRYKVVSTILITFAWIAYILFIQNAYN